MKARDPRKAVRASLRRMKKDSRGRIARNPQVQKERRARRIRRVLAVIILLILASLIRCECGPGNPKPAVDAGVKVLEVKKPPVPVKLVKKPKPPLNGKVTKQDRGAYANGNAVAPPWLDAFRLQVAARSPRLAKCFTGQDRPGALRWTSSVNPKSGAVSDHELAPIGTSDELKREQRTCVEAVLNTPRYLFEGIGEEALPSRISIVIEF